MREIERLLTTRGDEGDVGGCGGEDGVDRRVQGADGFVKQDGVKKEDDVKQGVGGSGVGENAPGMTACEARAYVTNMLRSKRYLQDIWS
jgi:hypothetical protein